MSVLVLGAGGFLGLNTVDALLALGVKPLCGRRARGNVLGLRQRKVPLVEADLNRPQSLVEAMRGCRTVVHLAGHYPRLSTDPAGSTALACRQTQAVLDAAAGAGVARLIYVSSTATVAARSDRPSDEGDRFDQAPGFGAYHDLKWQMEQRVAAEQRLQTVTLCPAACVGPFDWKAGTSGIFWQLKEGRCPPQPDGLVSWVDVRDVGLAIAALVTRELQPPRLLLSAQSLGFQALLKRLAARWGAGPLPPPIADEEARQTADAEEQRAARDGGRPSMSRELVDLVIHGARLDGHLAERLLGFTYRPLGEALDAFDAWADPLTAAVPTRSRGASV